MPINRPTFVDTRSPPREGLELRSGGRCFRRHYPHRRRPHVQYEGIRRFLRRYSLLSASALSTGSQAAMAQEQLAAAGQKRLFLGPWDQAEIRNRKPNTRLSSCSTSAYVPRQSSRCPRRPRRSSSPSADSTIAETQGPQKPAVPQLGLVASPAVVSLCTVSESIDNGFVFSPPPDFRSSILPREKRQRQQLLSAATGCSCLWPSMRNFKTLGSSSQLPPTLHCRIGKQAPLAILGAVLRGCVSRGRSHFAAFSPSAMTF